MSWMSEYPRPQLKRDSFFSLNGCWQLNGHPIEIPFPPESSRSGYPGSLSGELSYSRTFLLPEGFAKPGFRIRLHFGAVDQVADVQLNGCPVARHEGGYLPFFADITDALRPGDNLLTVRAVDTLSSDYPYGKQSKKRGGMWYTPVSGIWQSVWMEAVPEQPIEGVRIIPDTKGIELTVLCEREWCEVSIPGIFYRRMECNHPFRIDIPAPQLWSPDSPFLYPLLISTRDDRVESYFALRRMEITNSPGVPRVLLNGKPVFLNGILDQGYFPEGIYLPSSPAEYEADILRMKEMGINLLRKHAKIEPDVFYHACDRLGILVMQDMVNSGDYRFLRDTALPTIGFTRRSDHTEHAEDHPRMSFFTQHMLNTAAHLGNHPCIIAWTIFNEGWGQFNADQHYDLLKRTDPTRLIDATSGWFHQTKSDVDSRHVYFRNKRLKGDGRPLFLSECGGYARPIEGHMFNPNGKYGYGSVDSEEALTAKIETMWREMVLPAIDEGLCGLVYTQLSDIEDEINGLYTYDRQICKVTAERLRRLADEAQRRLSARSAETRAAQ